VANCRSGTLSAAGRDGGKIGDLSMAIDRPLTGFRIVEASTFVAGPFAALMLADLGAHVVKVEQIPDGDPLRRTGTLQGGENLVFVNCNRDKETMFLDLTSEADQSAFRGLLAQADVLITNWRAARGASFGFSDVAVRALNPQLVWVKVSGYGQSGPLADQPAFDPVVQSRSGIGFVQGAEDDPQLLRFFFADKVAAMFAVNAVLAALVRRSRTGDGVIVDVPMLDSIAYFNFPDVYAGLTLIDPARQPLVQRARGSQPVRTADGWLLISPVGGRQLDQTLAAIGHPEWKARLLSSEPSELAPLLYDMLREELPRRTNAEWLEEFTRREVPAAPVLSPAQTLEDPQVVHSGIFGETDHPSLGALRMARYPARETR
jgi:crotonobetainyl-CoA:carnitine CoA-transferase CaiB-like acyl-CoA transferase